MTGATALDSRNPKFVPDRAIRQRLQPLFLADNWNGLVAVLRDWLTVFGTAAVNDHAFRSGRVWLGLLLYPVSLLVIGGQIRGLACLLHQSSHRCLARSKALNHLLGSLFTGWAVLQSWTGYYHHHITLHHRYLGDPDRDPDYRQTLQTGLYAEDTTRADVVRYIKRIPSPGNTVAYLRYLARDRVVPAGEEPWEAVLRLGFWAAVLSTAYCTGNFHRLVMYWFIPLLTTANWIGNLAELLEHYPLMGKGLDELHSSRNRLCGPVTDFIFNPHGDGYHLVHHLFPRLPHWHFRKAHDILMDDSCYREVNRLGRRDMLAVVEEMLLHVD